MDYARDNMTDSCENIFGWPRLNFNFKEYDKKWLEQSSLSIEFIRQYRFVPLEQEQNFISIGLSDPTDQQAMNAISFHTGLRVLPKLISEDELNQFLEFF